MGLGKTIQAIAAAEIMARHFGVERVLVVCPPRSSTSGSARSSGSPTANGDGRRGTPCRGASNSTRGDKLLQDHQLRRHPPRPRPDPALGARPGHPRRGAADQELEDADGAEREAARVALRDRPDRHAAGEPARGTGLDRASSSTRIAWGRCSASWPSTRSSTSTAGSSATATSIASARRSRRSSIRRTKDEVLKELPERLDKHFFVPMTPEQRTHHEENREIVARIVAKWRRYGFLSEADQRRLHDRPPEHADVLRQHLPAGSPDRLTGVKADELARRCSARSSSSPGRRWSSSASGCGCTSCWCGGSRRRGCEHVLFHGGVAGLAPQGLVDRFQGRPGLPGCSSRPTPAAWA